MLLLTAYNFTRGHIDRFVHDGGEIRVTLWREHNSYHVRAHNFETRTRLVWKTFSYLEDAREEFKLQKKAIQAGNLR